MKLCIIAIFALLVLSLAVMPGQAGAVPDPLTCTGYSTPRVFLDDQSWWLRTPGQNGNDFGHVHAATCFPLFQVVSGVVPFDIRLTMHDNPGEIYKLTIHIEAGNNNVYSLGDVFFNPPLTCLTTCDFWQHMDVDTAIVPLNGWQRFTFRALVLQPDGKEMHAASSYRAYLSNGNPRKDSIPIDRTQGKGWYTGPAYANSTVDGYTYGAPKSGIWPVKVICNATQAVTGCLVTVDPNFHAGFNGTVIYSGTSEFNGTVNINTAQFANGLHKLVVRTDVRDNGQGSTLSGVLGLPFEVQN